MRIALAILTLAGLSLTVPASALIQSAETQAQIGTALVCNRDLGEQMQCSER